jgi:hypothetical protein
MASAFGNTCVATKWKKCARRVRRIGCCKLNCALVELNIEEHSLALESWLECFAMNNQNGKSTSLEVDRPARNARRRRSRTVKHNYILQKENEEMIRREREYETCSADAERRQVLAEAAQSFIGAIEFYKTEHGGKKPHDHAVKEALQNYEWRRGYVAALLPQDVTWADLAAVADVDTDHALALWARLRVAADDELECGKRGAKVAGENGEPYALAQYLAIRDAFADQWQPQGGIESAMIEMLAIAYSLQMYWSSIANDRVMRVHDAQRDQLKRYELNGWKSPYQSEADAVDQAHRLADGYNRQFLRVLRQLRDLRRYTPVVIQSAQQVNVGNQQVNVSR